MNKNRFGFACLTGCLFTILLVLNVLLNYSWAEPTANVQVGLLAGESSTDRDKLILEAYKQVLGEEGFSYQVISPEEIIRSGAEGLKKNYEALIVPEFINAAMAPETEESIRSYVRDQGGAVLLFPGFGGTGDDLYGLLVLFFY